MEYDGELRRNLFCADLHVMTIKLGLLALPPVIFWTPEGHFLSIKSGGQTFFFPPSETHPGPRCVAEIAFRHPLEKKPRNQQADSHVSNAGISQQDGPKNPSQSDVDQDMDGGSDDEEQASPRIPTRVQQARGWHQIVDLRVESQALALHSMALVRSVPVFEPAKKLNGNSRPWYQVRFAHQES